MKKTLIKLYKEFFESEKTGGLILISCTLFSLIIANSAFGAQYLSLWDISIGGHNIVHWINDGLMTIFFLLIGLELEREVYVGDLSTRKNAILPIFAAAGGLLIPAAIYLAFNFGLPTQSGAGIPMATDIAFAIGILSLLGKSVPMSLKIFLTALAIIDDLGAIILIAVAYTETFDWLNLGIALGIYAFLILLNKGFKVYMLIPYLVGGIAMWYFMSHSGVHATITGVLLAFAIPFGKGKKKSPSYMLQHHLHFPVAFIILPLFALANTCIIIDDNWMSGFKETYSMGILAGLVLGKPIGIVSFTLVAVALGWANMPKGVNKKQIVGIGFIGGIGFTMSIFITLLAFDDQAIINTSKITILTASLTAGLLGFLWLKTCTPSQTIDEEIEEEEEEENVY